MGEWATDRIEELERDLASARSAIAVETRWKEQARTERDKARSALQTALAALAEREKEVERLRDALSKISAIRDSLIGAQAFNWSEHAYPLVAVLGSVGYEGAGYEIARKNLGTLLDQRDELIEALRPFAAEPCSGKCLRPDYITCRRCRARALVGKYGR